MKVKIGDKIVDANDEPIMLIFENEFDRITISQHLANMLPEARKYCIYPDTITEPELKEFMKI